MASNDRLGLEAIKSLHSQLDDDANGNVDLSESDDVIFKKNKISINPTNQKKWKLEIKKKLI